MLAVLLLTSACAGFGRDSTGAKKDPVVVAYSDFGYYANFLLGTRHWQWPSPDNMKPIKYNVKAVVYSAGDLEYAMKMFPVNQETQHDYRYIEYEKATAFLDEKIKENFVTLGRKSSLYKGHEDDVVFWQEIHLLYKTYLVIEKHF